MNPYLKNGASDGSRVKVGNLLPTCAIFRIIPCPWTTAVQLVQLNLPLLAAQGQAALARPSAPAAAPEAAAKWRSQSVASLASAAPSQATSATATTSGQTGGRYSTPPAARAATAYAPTLSSAATRLAAATSAADGALSWRRVKNACAKPSPPGAPAGSPFQPAPSQLPARSTASQPAAPSQLPESSTSSQLPVSQLPASFSIPHPSPASELPACSITSQSLGASAGQVEDAPGGPLQQSGTHAQLQEGVRTGAWKEGFSDVEVSGLQALFLGLMDPSQHQKAGLPPYSCNTSSAGAALRHRSGCWRLGKASGGGNGSGPS
jgi:hypothetical protein